jgi:site-specific DNA-methyltransferase (adenine-specific)
MLGPMEGAAVMHQILVTDCLDWMKAQPDASVDVVIGSPPYAEKGERYGGSKPWPTEDWVVWMCDITFEAARISKNVVVWIVNGAVRDGAYRPACEGLVWQMYQADMICERPCIWHKNAPPNRKDWFGNDWEYCLAFRPPHSNRYFDWEAIAKPPEYKTGGRFRQRTKTGERRLGNEYPQNKLARPRDVFRVTVGGGHMGSKLSHDNEACYPEGIVEPFVRTLCPIGGTVLDPFGGSGTTMAVAILNGRRSINIDVRQNQAELMERRRDESYERLVARAGDDLRLRESYSRLVRCQNAQEEQRFTRLAGRAELTLTDAEDLS